MKNYMKFLTDSECESKASELSLQFIIDSERESMGLNVGVKLLNLDCVEYLKLF